jgi:flagellar hook-basal body complex protein FliE
MASPTFAAGAYAAAQRLASNDFGRTPLQKPDTGEGSSFAEMVKTAVGGVAASGQKADAQSFAAATGNADLVQVVTAVAESEAAMQTLVAVRDKVISAYEDIMRMAI